MSTSTGRLSRRDLIVSSTLAGGALMLGPAATAVARLEGGGRLTDAQAQKLAGLMRGTLITPDDAGYDESRSVWNAMIDRHPSALAVCESDADVMSVLRFAREEDLPITIRGGGHNVAGKSVRDGAITIDLGKMNQVEVHTAAKRARVQGGARWAGVDQATLAQNLYTTGGTVGATGVGGLTLGGGLGWLMRKHGLSCDNLLGADVVTADGGMLRASADENPDLYWAIRGGGGNFGIVTSFDFQLHDEAPLYGGIAFFAQDRIRDMLEAYREFHADAPESTTVMAAIAAGPPSTPLEGAPCGMIVFCNNGPLAEGEALAQHFRDLKPAMDTMDASSYAAQQALFAAAGNRGVRNYWRSAFVRGLPDGLIDTLIERGGQMPHPATMLLIEPMGGAVSRVPDEATAFSNRGADFNVSVLGAWIDPANDAKNVPWARAVGDDFREYSTGGAYVNYMPDEDAEAVRGAYEANFQRLVAAKRKYDPDNVFSSNQNIAP